MLPSDWLHLNVQRVSFFLAFICQHPIRWFISAGRKKSLFGGSFLWCLAADSDGRGDPLETFSFTLEECQKLWTLHSETPCWLGAMPKRLPVKRELSIKRALPSPDASLWHRQLSERLGGETVWRRIPVPGFVRSGGYFRPSNLDRPIGRGSLLPLPSWRSVKEPCKM